MSHMASGILGAVAATLALGAVHLEVAAGNDLLGPAQRGDASTGLARPEGNTSMANVNRMAKGDRDVAARPTEGVTISFRVPGMPDSSVMMRMPAGGAADALRRAPVPAKTSSERGSAAPAKTIACEPVVSVLTSVARQLAPGRCIT